MSELLTSLSFGWTEVVRQCQILCVSGADEDISRDDNAATQYVWRMRFKPGFTWHMDHRVSVQEPASMKRRRRYNNTGNTVGETKDVSWVPHKANKLCRVQNEPTIIRRPRGHVWTHGLASLLFSRPLLFEEDYSAGTSVGVGRGPRHTRQTVGWQTPLTCTSRSAVTLSYSFTCEAHKHVLICPLCRKKKKIP